jgi:Flp pilus assembly protein TadD
MCEGYLYKSKGELEVKAGNFNAANESYDKALKIFRNGYKSEESEVLMLSGILLRLEGRSVESNNLIADALSLATKVGHFEVTQKCEKLLSDSC